MQMEEVKTGKCIWCSADSSSWMMQYERKKVGEEKNKEAISQNQRGDFESEGSDWMKQLVAAELDGDWKREKLNPQKKKKKQLKI